MDFCKLLIGDQVAISPAHLFGLVSDPLVDDALVRSGSRTIRAKGVPKDVPAAELVPLGAAERLLKVMPGLFAGERLGRCSVLARLGDIRFDWERVDAAGVLGEPLP